MTKQQYIHVMTSRLMKQVSSPAELDEVHTYFPDILLLRLFSFKVPAVSSTTTQQCEVKVRHACLK